MKTNYQTQQEILDKSYTWASNVVIKQKRFLDIDTMYIAYPFKKNGLTKEGLNILLENMKKVLSN